MKRIVGVLLTICFFAPSLWAAKAGYSASQSGGVVHVRTPFGSTVYLAEVGFENLDSYKFEIPLGDLRAQIQGTEGTGGSGGGNKQAGKDSESPPSESKPSEITDTDSLIAQANNLYNRGQFAQALGFVDELLRRDAKNVRGWTMKGSLMHILGHKDLAKQSWEKALQLDPKNESLKKVIGGNP